MPNPEDKVILTININKEVCSKKLADEIFALIHSGLDDKGKIDIHSHQWTHLEICDRMKYITSE